MSVKTPVNALHSKFVGSIEESFRESFGVDQRPQSTAARADLEEMPFPTTKSEFWRYTRLAPLTKNQFRFADPVSAQPRTEEIKGAKTIKLAFVNGIFQPSLSDFLPEGVSIELANTADDFPAKFNALAQPKKHVFEALNTAYCPQVAVVKVTANTSVEPLIHINHWSHSDNNISQPRLIFQVEQGAKASILQTFAGEETAGFTNSLSEFFVGANAALNVYKIESEQALRFHHSADYARVDSGGKFEILTTPVGGAWTRNNLHIKLDGQNAFARLNGLYFLKDSEHVDNNTFVDHAVPHCDSSELYKAVLSDKSTGVFNGKVIVRPDAQKTNAFQQNSNLLLSPDAQNFSKPELEIYADDVKCSHGSTTGQMDEEAVFYLRSRAIGLEDAQKMLVTAFAGEVLDQIEHDAIKEHLYKKFSH